MIAIKPIKSLQSKLIFSGDDYSRDQIKKQSVTISNDISFHSDSLGHNWFNNISKSDLVSNSQKNWEL